MCNLQMCLPHATIRPHVNSYQSKLRSVVFLSDQMSVSCNRAVKVSRISMEGYQNNGEPFHCYIAGTFRSNQPSFWERNFSRHPRECSHFRIKGIGSHTLAVTSFIGRETG